MELGPTLRALFEGSDLEPGYAFHKELGWRPDYPELGEVCRGEHPPANAPDAIRETWAAARADVMALHEDYLNDRNRLNP